MGKRRYHHGRYPVLKASSLGVFSEDGMQKLWMSDRRLTEEYKDHVEWLCESCHTPTKHKGDCVLNNSSKKKLKKAAAVAATSQANNNNNSYNTESGSHAGSDIQMGEEDTLIDVCHDLLIRTSVDHNSTGEDPNDILGLATNPHLLYGGSPNMLNHVHHPITYNFNSPKNGMLPSVPSQNAQTHEKQEQQQEPLFTNLLNHRGYLGLNPNAAFDYHQELMELQINEAMHPLSHASSNNSVSNIGNISQSKKQKKQKQKQIQNQSAVMPMSMIASAGNKRGVKPTFSSKNKNVPKNDRRRGSNNNNNNNNNNNINRYSMAVNKSRIVNLSHDDYHLPVCKDSLAFSKVLKYAHEFANSVCSDLEHGVRQLSAARRDHDQHHQQHQRHSISNGGKHHKQQPCKVSFPDPLCERPVVWCPERWLLRGASLFIADMSLLDASLFNVDHLRCPECKVVSTPAHPIVRVGFSPDLLACVELTGQLALVKEVQYQHVGCTAVASEGHEHVNEEKDDGKEKATSKPKVFGALDPDVVSQYHPSLRACLDLHKVSDGTIFTTSTRNALYRCIGSPEANSEEWVAQMADFHALVIGDVIMRAQKMQLQHSFTHLADATLKPEQRAKFSSVELVTAKFESPLKKLVLGIDAINRLADLKFKARDTVSVGGGVVALSDLLASEGLFDTDMIVTDTSEPKLLDVMNRVVDTTGQSVLSDDDATAAAEGTLTTNTMSSAEAKAVTTEPLSAGFVCTSEEEVAAMAEARADLSTAMDAHNDYINQSHSGDTCNVTVGGGEPLTDAHVGDVSDESGILDAAVLSDGILFLGGGIDADTEMAIKPDEVEEKNEEEEKDAGFADQLSISPLNTSTPTKKVVVKKPSDVDLFVNHTLTLCDADTAGIGLLSVKQEIESTKTRPCPECLVPMGVGLWHDVHCGFHFAQCESVDLNQRIAEQIQKETTRNQQGTAQNQQGTTINMSSPMTLDLQTEFWKSAPTAWKHDKRAGADAKQQKQMKKQKLEGSDMNSSSSLSPSSSSSSECRIAAVAV